MIDLFRSEFLRARSRRILPMMLVGGVLLIVVAMVIAGANSHKPTAGADRGRTGLLPEAVQPVACGVSTRAAAAPTGLRHAAGVLRRP